VSDLPSRLVELEDLATWLRNLPVAGSRYAYLYSEYLSVGDPLPDAAGQGVDAALAKEIRKRLDREWGSRVWGGPR
jgi:hypothetical protein